CIRLRAVQSVANRLCWIAFLTQEQVCPRVEKEIAALFACRSTNGCDPACLPVHWIEPGALDDAVFEIDPDHAEFEKARDVFGQRTIVVAVSAFEVDRHRRIDRAGDPRDDLLDEHDRDGFTVPVTLRLCDSPTAGRNCLCARVQNRFRGASVPRVVQQQRRPFDVELGKSRGFFGLVHVTLLLLCVCKRSSRCGPLETDQASTRLIGPRKSILPTSTPLWRRMA